MGKNNNIIEINGQRYDARTGTVLGAATGIPAAHRNVDGIIQNAAKAHTTPVAPATALAPQAPQPLPKSAWPSNAARTTAKHNKTHAQQPASTLMRSAVKKPAPSLKRSTKAQTHALVEQPSHTITAKPSINTLRPERLAHAKKIAKSPAITKFPQTQAVVAQTQQPTPVVNTPRKAAPAAYRNHVTPPQAKVPPVSKKTTADLLQQALNNAQSHQEPAPKHIKKLFGLNKKVVGLGTGVVLAAVVVGIVGIQSANDIRVQVASAKAGFSAGLPNNKPAGYRMDSLHYSPGVVAIGYRSNSDNRAYSITEKNSEWDSATLRDMYVSKQSRTFQTVSVGGRTIYLYGQNQATWVNAGVWYNVQSNGALSNRQLIDLANSF